MFLRCRVGIGAHTWVMAVTPRRTLLVKTVIAIAALGLLWIAAV